MDALRDYQKQAVLATYDYLRNKTGNPCIVCPTGAGKSHILAQICHDAIALWNGRVLVLTHVKELIEQNAAKTQSLIGKENVGIYSAGLNRRDMAQPVIAASIQSIYKRACDFEAFDLVIVDEAHLIPPDGDGMYRQFLSDAQVVNPRIRVIGLTATPFRMATGMLCGPDQLLNEICYDIGVRELILQGYLCPLKSKAARHRPDTSGLHIRAGEFIASEIADLMDEGSLVYSACNELIEQTKDRSSVLIFAAGTDHARHIQEALAKKTGQDVGLVTGDTPPHERTETIARFRKHVVKTDLFGTPKPPLKYLVNVNVLTTGFDAPNIDCVVLLRPTNSPGLYYQMVGRGFRLHQSKQDCLVLDFGGNILRHGPVDSITAKEHTRGTGKAPVKECPNCNAIIAAGYSACPECGHAFAPPEKSRHEASASTEGILSGEITDTEYTVRSVRFCYHTKRDAPPNTPPTLRVEYEIGWQCYQSEWICFEHTGYARRKAEHWWQARSNEPVPNTIEEAIELAEAGALAETECITVRSITGQAFDRIIKHQLGPKPPLLDGSDERDDGFLPAYSPADDDIPF